MKRLPIFLIIFCLTAPAFGQFSAQSLSTFRNGKLPRQDASNNDSYYSDIMLMYSSRYWQSGLRLEGFTAPDLTRRYSQINQYYLAGQWQGFDLRLGHLFEIFGKGILLRGFELPGFIYEDVVSRVQHSVVRDIRGVRLRFNRGPVELSVLNGTMADATSTPQKNDWTFLGIDYRGYERARPTDVRGGQFKLHLPYSIMLGGAYLRNETTFITHTASRFLNWDADLLLQKFDIEWLSSSFYGEYATEQGVGAFADLGDDAPHALYLANTTTIGNFGVSTEYKDYALFNYGINDPPPLVRESPKYLLNRATHVLEAANESGYQIEAFYSPTWTTRIIANYSLARNRFGGGFSTLFQERYLEFEYLDGPWLANVFFDTGQDDLVFERERRTAGIGADYELSSPHTVGVDVQFQRMVNTAFDDRFENMYGSLKYSGWQNVTFSISTERTTDPTETMDAKFFTNVQVGWAPTHRFSVSLFTGSRRRGTACDHGYCIQVLDFEGTELRVETRF